MSSMRHDPSHRRGPILGSVTRLSSGSADPRGRNAALSIIVPAKNEADSLPQLIREILEAFRPKVRGAVDSAADSRRQRNHGCFVTLAVHGEYAVATSFAERSDV